MHRFAKIALITGLSIATLAGNFSAASAGDWGRRQGSHDRGWYGGGWNHDNGWRDRDRRHNRNNAIAAGVLGLAAGAIIAGALSQPQPQPIYREPIYNAPPPPPAYYPQPVRATFEPWSREWYNWCSQRYRSFNAQSGTYRGYDGQDHFCVAN